MTPKRSGKVCVPATSSLGLPNETLIMAADWADGDGWWSEPSLGLISFAACASAMKSEPTSMRLC
jgi:hypothetical protein